ANGGYSSALNDPPLPARDLMAMPASGSLIIPVSDLLANDFDLERTALTLSLAETRSSRGGTIALSNSRITYTPSPLASSEGDSFNYVVSDGSAQSLGTVVLFS